MTRSLALVLLLAACGGASASDPAATAPATAAEPSAATAAEPSATLAPDFTLADLDGQPVTLSSLRGKTVVLEWFNPGCPFVKYAHGDGPLRTLPARAIKDGAVWLAINSSAPGKQGHGVELNREAAKTWSMGYPVLVDERGEVGKRYGATATPTIVVIDPAGAIAYKGALDDAPLGRAPSAGGVNYAEKALAALAAGGRPEVAETKAYGCGVKY
jgi:hypothetical protein